jgi:hypothetical protein
MKSNTNISVGIHKYALEILKGVHVTRNDSGYGNYEQTFVAVPVNLT